MLMMLMLMLFLKKNCIVWIIFSLFISKNIIIVFIIFVICQVKQQSKFIELISCVYIYILDYFTWCNSIEQEDNILS